jgi:hypothetical protein
MNGGWKKWVLLALSLLIVPAAAQAHGFWTVGINVGFPVCYRPWCGYGYYGYPCYRPYPVYVAPPPIYVAPAPVVQTAPVTLPAYPTPVYPSAQANQVVPAAQTAQTDPVPAEARQSEITRLVRDLGDPNENVRADSAMQLGRMKATRAIDPVAARLAGDKSPLVRDAAARALGLMGSSKSLPALTRAALDDTDRDVRRSAQFSKDVIQTNR